jgi:hypothetical protein
MVSCYGEKTDYVNNCCSCGSPYTCRTGSIHSSACVVCALFACPRCNAPLIGAKFTSCTAADVHEAVFELRCDTCDWCGAILGRDALQNMIADWSSRTVRYPITGV